jgi:predicted dehydrogenase
MALDLTPEQKETGKQNFARAAAGLKKAEEDGGLWSRRDVLKSLAIAGGALVVTTPAVYFGYQGFKGLGGPVKAALIGAGDEGGVLIGEHNPEYLEIIAVCDIRPSNKRRIFDGEPAPSPRKGLNFHYGNNAKDNIKVYDNYMDLLKAHKNELEAVVIALPLHWHAKCAIDCMRFGQERGKPLHVLCEKLMAWNIRQAKKMISVAKDTNSILSIGHQRHYSMLYAHAAEAVESGIIGDIKHIRALWHRNFAWPFEFKPKRADDKMVEGEVQPTWRDGWYNPILIEDYDPLKSTVTKYGYNDVKQLVRWRTYKETGGGLMAELGSHQLDACSIFLGHVHPLAVTGVGTRSFFGPHPDGHPGNDRDIDDHVFVTYEFPGKNYARDKNDVVVVTYSSISTNQFEKYGECLMGTRGTLLVEEESSLMLYAEMDPNAKAKGQPRAMEVGVVSTGGGKPALETGSTWSFAAGTPPPGAVAGPAGTNNGPVSRGYKEEMEDFAFCIKMWDAKAGYAEKGGKYVQRLPRCHGEIALADAIVALTANQAMHDRKRVEFKEGWFDAKSSDVPDDPKAKPKVEVE